MLAVMWLPSKATRTMQGTMKMLGYHQLGNSSLVVMQASLQTVDGGFSVGGGSSTTINSRGSLTKERLTTGTLIVKVVQMGKERKNEWSASRTIWIQTLQRGRTHVIYRCSWGCGNSWVCIRDGRSRNLAVQWQAIKEMSIMQVAEAL